MKHGLIMIRSNYLFSIVLYLYLVKAYDQGTVGLDKHFFKQKDVNIFNKLVLTQVLGAQKNHLIETALLSTHNRHYSRASPYRTVSWSIIINDLGR